MLRKLTNSLEESLLAGRFRLVLLPIKIIETDIQVFLGIRAK